MTLSKHSYTDEEAVTELSNLGRYDVSPGSTLTQYTNIIKAFIIFCEKHRPGLLFSPEEALRLALEAECTDEKIRIIYRFNMAAIKADNFNTFGLYMVSYKNPKTGLHYQEGVYVVMKAAFKKIFEWRASNNSYHEVPKNFNVHLDRIKKRIAKKVADDQKKGIRHDIDMATDGLSRSHYELICLYFFEKGMIKELFYTTLEWNLMCRINQIRDLNTDAISWRNDCATFLFVKTKANQKGGKGGVSGKSFQHFKHVYANPHKPYVCPLTALGLYLLSHKITDNKLIPRDYDCDCHVSALRSAATALGFKDVEKIGSHSLRKGAWSDSQAGTTASPSIAATCLRADHSLGKVKDAYNYGGEAGDCLLGRILALLNPNNLEIASLPPHFKIDDDIFEKCNQYFDGDIHQESFQALLPYLLANVVFHYEAIKHGMVVKSTNKKVKKMCSTSRIWRSALFRSPSILDLREKLYYLPGEECFESAYMSGSGIPPHCEVLLTLRTLKTDFKKDVKEIIDEALDSRNVGNPASKILLDVQQQQSELQKCIEGLKKDLADFKSGSITADKGDQQTRIVKDGIEHFAWAGKFRKIPVDYTLPFGLHCYDAFSYWCIGDQLNGVLPFHKLSGMDFKTRREQKEFCYVKRICETLCKDKAVLNKITNEQMVRHHFRAYENKLPKAPNAKYKRQGYGNLKVSTIYDLFPTKKRKRKRRRR